MLITTSDIKHKTRPFLYVSSKNEMSLFNQQMVCRYRLTWRPSDEAWPVWSGVKQGSDIHFLLGQKFGPEATKVGGGTAYA